MVLIARLRWTTVELGVTSTCLLDGKGNSMRMRRILLHIDADLDIRIASTFFSRATGHFQMVVGYESIKDIVSHTTAQDSDLTQVLPSASLMDT